MQFRPEDISFAERLIQEIPNASNGTAEQLASLIESQLRDFEIDYKVEVVDKHGFGCRQGK